MESAAQDADGRPIQTGVEDLTGAKYGSAFGESVILYADSIHS